MLPEFRGQLFQLPLIATTWTSARNRYIQEKQNSSLPIRFILIIIEQTILSVHKNIIQPLPLPYHSYLNSLDHFLCSHINSIRHICPIVDQTSDEVIERYSNLFFLSVINKSSKSSTINSNFNNITNVRKEKKFKFFETYFRFITNILMVIEMYSKSIKNELNDYIDTTRNLWKNLNMEDGRSLDEVESFSEKLLVLGRRMTGNYRQLVYLMRYQLKRCRYILFSFIRVHYCFRTTAWRITRKIQMNKMNQKFNVRARYGIMSSKERVHHYLDVMMLHAAKHPWMRWITPSSPKPQPQQPLTSIRPIFFVSSNNTSECSGSEENVRDSYPKYFESTPYRRNFKRTDIIQSKLQIEEALSNVSSSSSSTLEPSVDVKDIIRQVESESSQTLDTSCSVNQDDENQIIEQALNETDGNGQQQQQPVSVFDLSPMLASGCAV
ncbi:unnamed protein product [Adineta steineri]|uniref:Uncharacterized protein n=1 Tax=Adineta steineri TaxID=433720 RepID=A0A819E485_9BILA|nr:unnamed protein product [Adineta steineri]